jgi:hypothetical protein
MALKAQIGEMTALMATTTPAATTGAAHAGKRAPVHKNGKTTLLKAVITCTVLAPTRMSFRLHDFMLALLFSTKYLFLIPRPLF